MTSAHATLGALRRFGARFSFSDTPVAPGGARPMAGQHPRELLAPAGRGADDVEAHPASGVVAEPSDGYPRSI